MNFELIMLWLNMGCIGFSIFFIILSGSFAKADCFVEFRSKDQIVLSGDEKKYLIVVPSDYSEKKIKKYRVRSKKIKIKKIMTERNRFSEYSTGDIVKAIRQSQKSVVIFAEEKSAADVLEAFIQYPHLKSKVDCFYSIKGYIRGAEYAENAKAPLDSVQVERASRLPIVAALRFVLDMFVRIFNRVDPIQYSFHTQIRNIYLKDHDNEIFEISKKINFISIDSGEKDYGRLPYSEVLNY